MSRYVFKMPDLGEGTVTAEVVEWKVKVGDTVTEDQIIAEVMTDKAAVEIPAPVSGRVLSITGQPGEMVAVGSELIAFETSGAPDATATPASKAPADAKAQAAPAAAPAAERDFMATRIMASPATRRKATMAGIDLATLSGSGPGGRISAQDIESVISGKGGAGAKPVSQAPRKGVDEIKIIGVRRVIAERMSAAKRNIPHFAYVEEVDITELESLRQYLNSRLAKGAPNLTYLPFLVAALVRVLEAFRSAMRPTTPSETSSCVMPPCTLVSPPRRRTGSRCPSCATPRRARSMISPRKYGGFRKPRAATRRRAMSWSAPRSPSRASGGSAALRRRPSSMHRKLRSSA